MVTVGWGGFLITGKASEDCKLSLRNPACGGAEERRLRRMMEGNAADDALPVIRGKLSG